MITATIETHGIITTERLPDGYYWFTWSSTEFDHTERVHPWNATRRIEEINAKYGA